MGELWEVLWRSRHEAHMLPYGQQSAECRSGLFPLRYLSVPAEAGSLRHRSCWMGKQCSFIPPHSLRQPARVCFAIWPYEKHWKLEMCEKLGRYFREQSSLLLLHITNKICIETAEIKSNTFGDVITRMFCVKQSQITQHIKCSDKTITGVSVAYG